MAVFEPFRQAVGVFFLVLVVSFIATRGAVAFARHFNWTAKSNKRSSHVGTLAFGGGIPVVVLTLGGWVYQIFPLNSLEITVLSGAIGLAVVSLIDDLKPLSATMRIGFQAIVVIACLYVMPMEKAIIPVGWPLIIDRLVVALCWLWFINLFNFMDGIDGLAGVETISIAFGLVVVGAVVSMPSSVVLLAIVLAAAAVGFLPWNWHRAKIMLGDVGSVPIGFLLGYMLIEMAVAGYLLVALILPAYFVVDASFTLLRRMLRGEKIWQAHREHFYQQATSSFGHDKVVILVVVANAILIGMAYWSLSQPLFGAIGAILTIAVLIIRLRKMSKAT